MGRSRASTALRGDAASSQSARWMGHTAMSCTIRDNGRWNRMPNSSHAYNPTHASSIAIDNQALISLAILKVNWDVLKKDYLENFVPIVSESIRLLPDDVVSLAELQATVRSSFGLELPQNSLKTILGRIKKRGFIRLENNVYYRNMDALQATNFRDVRQHVLHAHESLLADICQFSMTTYGVEWTTLEAESALQAYLNDSESDIVAATGHKTILAGAQYTTKSERFIVASYVQLSHETQSPSCSHLDTILKGRMLANAIFLPDMTNADRRFRKTEVYFDTSFIIFALGYAGQPRKDPCVELLSLLWETGADLRCFEHTIDEVRGALMACAHRIEKGALQDAYGPSIEYFIEHGSSATDIVFYANRLVRDLQSLRIKILPKPTYVNKFMIGEKDLADALRDAIPSFTFNQQALDRDVASISAIMRLRGTASYFYIEECHALFVTTNQKLVRVVGDVLMAKSTPGAVPPALTDYNLTNLLWLKKPLSAPNLPIKRLIADCYAAVQPDDRLWKRYLDEIEKLRGFGQITKEDVFLLRHSLEAKTALMEKTLGDEAVFADATVAEILQIVRSQIEAKLRAERDVEAEATKAALDRLEAEKQSAIESRAAIKRNSQNIAARCVKVLTVAVWLALGLSTLYSAPVGFPAFSSRPIKDIIFSIDSVFLLFGAFHLYFGTPLKVYIRQLELFLAIRIESRLLRLAGMM